MGYEVFARLGSNFGKLGFEDWGGWPVRVPLVAAVCQIPPVPCLLPLLYGGCATGSPSEA